MRLLVFGDGELASRTLRRVPTAMHVRTVEELATELDRVVTSAWVLWAGALPSEQELPSLPPAPRALVALGAVDLPAGEGWARATAWHQLLQATGGDLETHALRDELPLASVAVDAKMADAWSVALSETPDAIQSLAKAARKLAARVVRLPGLDVILDERIRVLSIITSLQQGGAERLVVELAAELPSHGVATRICTVGRAVREVLPCNAVDLSHHGRSSPAQIDAVHAEAARWGADLLHAHLLGTDELRALGRTLPMVTTIHNARAGWPSGTDALDADATALIIACALDVEDQLHTAGVKVPVRTVWNGIDGGRLGYRPDDRAALRARFELTAEALVLLCIANPRPQKRLELLPPVVAELVRRGIDAHLWLLGDETASSPAAQVSEAALSRALEADPALPARVRRLGPHADVGKFLAAADVAVSTSLFEGLSLAQLEARAVGLPQVACDVGGTREIADGDDGMRLVSVDAGPVEMADAILALRATPRSRSMTLRRFGIAGAAARHATLYRSLLSAPAAPTSIDVVLVANNFSVGGAQSSARRLLTGLAGRGLVVEAVVLQEDPSRPTPGRQALDAAGIPVQALPPSWTPPQAVDELVRALGRKRPRVLFFWNVISEHKVRLADALLDQIPIIDVSPGEMYFSSLDTFIAGWKTRPDVPLRDERDYGRRLHAVVVKFEGERARAASIGAPVHVIPNGVPMPAEAARGSQGKLVFGTAARLAPHKRLDLLIDAFHLAAPRLPPFEVRIAGGPEPGSEAHAAELRTQAADLPFTWLGSIDDDRMGAFLDGLDVFVMVSEPAGCPNASLEAMAAGLPLVVTDHGGAADQITDDVGLVTPRHDVAALAEAIVSLAHDPNRRRHLGEAARLRAATHYSINRMVDAYLALIPAAGHRAGTVGA